MWEMLKGCSPRGPVLVLMLGRWPGPPCLVSLLCRVWEEGSHHSLHTLSNGVPYYCLTMGYTAPRPCGDKKDSWRCQASSIGFCFPLFCFHNQKPSPTLLQGGQAWASRGQAPTAHALPPCAEKRCCRIGFCQLLPEP